MRNLLYPSGMSSPSFRVDTARGDNLSSCLKSLSHEPRCGLYSQSPISPRCRKGNLVQSKFLLTYIIWVDARQRGKFQPHMSLRGCSHFHLWHWLIGIAVIAWVVTPGRYLIAHLCKSVVKGTLRFSIWITRGFTCSTANTFYFNNHSWCNGKQKKALAFKKLYHPFVKPCL